MDAGWVCGVTQRCTATQGGCRGLLSDAGWMQGGCGGSHSHAQQQTQGGHEVDAQQMPWGRTADACQTPEPRWAAAPGGRALLGGAAEGLAWPQLILIT